MLKQLVAGVVVAKTRVLAATLLMWAVALVPLVSKAEEVAITGCPQPGIEAGCIMLSSGGKLYNITAAVPPPQLGLPGRVTGSVNNGVSLCMQGIILSPATWEPIHGAACPDSPSPD